MTKKEEDRIDKTMKLLRSIINDKEGKFWLVEQLELNKKSERMKRELDKIDSRIRMLEHKLISKFELTLIDHMNLSIALRVKGLEEILKKEVKK